MAALIHLPTLLNDRPATFYPLSAAIIIHPSYPISTGPTSTTPLNRDERTATVTTAPDPIQVGENTVTQKSLYTGLFVIGIPLLWFASPFSTVFWLIGASSVLILGHATLMEPGIESEYAQVQDSV